MTDTDYIKRRHRLPKWAQSYINDLNAENARLRALEHAHAVLSDREWFTIPNTAEEPFHLFRLLLDRAQQVATIGPDDVLLVGRGIDRELRDQSA